MGKLCTAFLLFLSLESFAEGHLFPTPEVKKACHEVINFESMDAGWLFSNCTFYANGVDFVTECAKATKLMNEFDKGLLFKECLDSDAEISLIKKCTSSIPSDLRPMQRTYYFLQCIGKT